jgi:hypothetical protein
MSRRGRPMHLPRPPRRHRRETDVEQRLALLRPADAWHAAPDAAIRAVATLEREAVIR